MKLVKFFLPFTLIPVLFLGQTTTTNFVGPQSQFLWDKVTQDVLGNPEPNPVKYELAYSAAGKDLNALGNVALKIVSVDEQGFSGVQATTLLNGVAPGNYSCQVRAVDSAGNKSSWSVALPITWDTTGPKVPANFRVTITIQVTSP